MAKKASKQRSKQRSGERPGKKPTPIHRSSSLIDTRIIYCGDCLDQLRKLPDGCIAPVYIDPPFNSNRNDEVFWRRSSEPRPSGSGPPGAFEDRHASTQAYIDYTSQRWVVSARAVSAAALLPSVKGLT